MTYSEVLVKVLNKAGEVQREAKVEHVSAPAILVAVAELCEEKYDGLTNYLDEHYPVWYEEERLRYLFKKLFRVSGNLVSYSVSRRLQKEFLKYDVDYIEENQEQLEIMMEKRGLHVLTADVVFLVALNSIKEREKLGLKSPYPEEIIVDELLKEVDGCIYDYVIAEVGKVQEQLQKKVDEAKAKRDWKPAARFIEPEEMLERFFASVQVKKDEKSLELVFPYFYEGERELQLTIIWIDGIYYVRDAHGVTRCFCQIVTFMRYLQEFILLDASEKTGYIPVIDEVEVDWSKAEAFDVETFLEELKQCIVVRYDENEGLILSIVHMCYANQDVSVSFLFKTEENGLVTISDRRKGFEANEYLKNFYLSEMILDGNYLPLLFRFFGRAVQMTEMEEAR